MCHRMMLQQIVDINFFFLDFRFGRLSHVKIRRLLKKTLVELHWLTHVAVKVRLFGFLGALYDNRIIGLSLIVA